MTNILQFRHEVKHEISFGDSLILSRRLKAVMESDKHTENGLYEIRSLYFDTVDDKALREKANGINIREKYRIRLYNSDTSVIRLERKYKHGDLGFKDSVLLTKEQAQAIVKGDYTPLSENKDSISLGLFIGIKNNILKPKVIVDYTREPFVFAPGNVRVTIDSNIRTGLGYTEFLNKDCVTVPIAGNPCILEVKWDTFLPDIVRDAVQLESRHATAFSKYAACRMYD